MAESVVALARSPPGTSAKASVFIAVKFIERVMPASSSTP